MKRNSLYMTIILIAIVLVSGCFAGPNTEVGLIGSDGQVAGFLMGLWHGIIAPFTFIISLFSENIHMYEIHNNGGWYDFGFVIGAGILFGSGSKATCKKRR